MSEKYICFEDYSKLADLSTGIDDGITSYGTWGHGGAGILIVSSDYKNIMLFERSHSMESGKWGISGGARCRTENGDLEDALITAVSETKEELGKLPVGQIRSEPYIYKDDFSPFTYQTFILEMDSKQIDSFIPKLNYEHTNWGWFDRDSVEYQVELHHGVREVLENYDF